MAYGKQQQEAPHQATLRKEDWVCQYCQFKNFSKRSVCHVCKATRVMPTHDGPKRPRRTSVLVVHGFNPRTMTKDSVIDAFQRFQRPLQDVRIVGDGTCHVEFYSVADAANVHFKCSSIYLGGEHLEVTALEEPSNPQPETNHNYQQQQQSSMQRMMKPRPQPPAYLPPVVDLRFDEASNYYYDAVTGYYYDSSTCYFYDGSSGFYYEFDPAIYSFVIADPSVPSQARRMAQERMDVETKPGTEQPVPPAKKKKTIVVSAAPSTVGVAAKQVTSVQSAPPTANSTANTNASLACTGPSNASVTSPDTTNAVPLSGSTSDTFASSGASSNSANSASTPLAAGNIPTALEPILKNVDGFVSQGKSKTADGFAVPIGKPPVKRVTFALPPVPSSPDSTPSSPLAKESTNTSNNNHNNNSNRIDAISPAPQKPATTSLVTINSPEKPHQNTSSSNSSSSSASILLTASSLPSANLSSTTATTSSASPTKPVPTPPVHVPSMEELIGRITRRNCCLLCRRKFESDVHLERHCTLSDMHRSNLKLKQAEVTRAMRSQQPKKVFPKKRKDPDAKLAAKNNSDVASPKSGGSLGPEVSISSPQMNTSPLLGFTPQSTSYGHTPYSHVSPTAEPSPEKGYTTYRQKEQNSVRQTMRDRFHNLQAAEQRK